MAPRRIFFVAAVLLSLAFNSVKAQDDTFSMAVLGDSRVALPGSPVPPGYLRILDEINLINPDLCFHTGNLIYGYQDSTGQLKDEYRQAYTILSRLIPKTYVVPGNHDYFSGASAGQFRKYFGKKDYYSFAYKGATFIILNTEMEGSQADIGGTQRRWLEGELRKAQGGRAIFVFLHRPLFSPLNPDINNTGIWPPDINWTNRTARDTLANLFARYKVTAVFSGHEHLYYTTTYKGVAYYIVGGGGAPLSATPDKGGFLSYLLVTVSGSSFSTKLIEPFHLSASYKVSGSSSAPTIEIQVDNTLSDSFKDVTVLSGLRVTVPKGTYTLSADTVAPRPFLRRLLIDNGMYKTLGLPKDFPEQTLNTLIPKMLNASIYQTTDRRGAPAKTDLWIRTNTLGNISHKLTIRPQ